MSMKNHNQLKWGSILSYAQMGLSVLIGLLYTPVMLRLLGRSEYGLYNTVASTISMLGLLNLGFNSGYIRYFAKYKVNDDKESIWKLNGLFLIIFTVIGLVALLCGLFLTFHLEMVFKSGLTAEEYGIARILMLLMTLNLAISFPMSVFSMIISANERFIFLKILGMLNTVLGPLLTLPLLLMGYRSIAMVSVSVALALITNVIYVYYVLHVLRNRFIFRDFERGIFSSLFAYTLFIAINIIVDQINWNIDKLLLTRFKGTSAVAVYSVGYSLYSYYMSFSVSVSGVFTPRIHKIVNETRDDHHLQRQQLTDLFVKVGRIQFLILGLIASGMVFFGHAFLTQFWAGPEYSDSYAVALLLMLPASIALTQNVGIEIQRALNLHQFRSLVYLGMALVNLGLSIYLCQKYGAIGSAVGTAISLIVANGLVMNIYYHLKCNMDVLAFWKNIIRMCLGLILPVAFGVAYTRILNVTRPYVFVLGIAAYTVVYCVSVWCFSMNPYEKTLVCSIFSKLQRRSA